MSKRVISTTSAPAAIGPYSQAVAVDNLLFTAGQIALDPVSMTVVPGDVGPAQRLTDDIARVGPDLCRVVLDPSRAGKDLLVLDLAGGDDAARVVEDDRPRAGGALVDGDNVLRHAVLLR